MHNRKVPHSQDSRDNQGSCVGPDTIYGYFSLFLHWLNWFKHGKMCKTELRLLHAYWELKANYLKYIINEQTTSWVCVSLVYPNRTVKSLVCSSLQLFLAKNRLLRQEDTAWQYDRWTLWSEMLSIHKYWIFNMHHSENKQFFTVL